MNQAHRWRWIISCGASELAKSAEAAGADGILILPPYGQTNDDGLHENYRSIASASALALSIAGFILGMGLLVCFL